jgi:anti-anti-sigma factor
MPNAPRAHVQWYDSNGIAVVEVLSREIRHPDPAQELSAQLNTLVDQEGRTRILINFHKTRYLSSSAFAVLFNLAKKLDAAGGQLRLCSMTPDVRTGASILRLGQYAEIYDDERSALASFEAAERKDA